MDVLNGLSDAVLATANAIIAVLCVAAVIMAYRRVRAVAAVWDDRSAWLGPAMAGLAALVQSAVMIGIVWGAWKVLGLPSWGRWLFG